MQDFPDDTTEQSQSSSDERTASSRRKRKSSKRVSVLKLLSGFVIIVLMITVYVLANRNSSVSNESAKQVLTAAGKIPEVEVLDGVGNMKIAQRATEYIRSAGFDVVEMKRNAEGVEGKSFIVDHTGNLEAAKQLAQAMGISETKVFQKINPKLLLDITIVIGEDYQSLTPFIYFKERNVR